MLAELIVAWRAGITCQSEHSSMRNGISKSDELPAKAVFVNAHTNAFELLNTHVHFKRDEHEVRVNVEHKPS